MVCQEDIYRFFAALSIKMREDGYPILDNLIHEFPGIPSYDEILEDKMLDRELDGDPED